MIDINEWLRRPNQHRIYLVKASYRLDGEVKTLYRATFPFRTGANDTPAYQPYPDSIISTGEFERDMTEVYIGLSRSTSGNIEFAIDEETRHLSQNAHFLGGDVTIKMGGHNWLYSDFVTVVKSAVGESLEIVNDVAVLAFKDRSSAFKKDVQASLIVNGPNAGKPVPICLGRCFNVSPVLINAVENRWKVHEGAISALPAVRENGNTITNITPDLANGEFVINNSVSGRVTCDVDGAVNNGVWMQTGEEFITYLLAKHGFAAPYDVNVLPAYLLGLYISNHRQLTDVFDEIVSNFVASWQFDRQNRFRLRMKAVAA
jgi:hypothetical protein